MKDYIGFKHIKARPMNRSEFNDYSQWAIALYDGDGQEEGYLVEEFLPNENYINSSWLAKDVFDKAYHEIHNHADPDLVIMDMLHTLKEGVS